jgi:RAD51-like protein 2
MTSMLTGNFSPLGRSAAELISTDKRFISSCIPLDRLLGEGLPSGHILELSGPPGTAKETLVSRFASNAVSSNDQVLFVGKMQHDGQFAR